MELLKELALSVEKGDDKRSMELTEQAVAGDLVPREILSGGLIAGMDVVGEQFRKHEIFLPDVLLAAKAMKAGVEIIKPLLLKDDVPDLGKVVLGTVQGDLHDIGKNLVGIMLEGAGFEVVDLGHDVAPERFVDAALENGAKIIGMSTLLTTTMPVMKTVVDTVKERGLSGEMKTIVGGAPVSSEYAAEIGADAYGFDGANAVDTVKALMGIR